jgi:hypothetical protein
MNAALRLVPSAGAGGHRLELHPFHRGLSAVSMSCKRADNKLKTRR